MRFYCLILFVFSNVLFSQNSLKGYLKDDESKLSVVGANIFVANTSLSTISDQNGFFELMIQNSNAEIIVSCVGYETISINVKSLLDFDTKKVFNLKKSTTNLDEVAVSFKDVKNRKLALKIFINNFIGKSEMAGNVKILNPEVIEFREESLPHNYKLIAFADKPVILINKKLGYKISYVLIDFEYNLDNAHENMYAYYKGYASFTDIVKEFKLDPEKIFENRQITYLGSGMHFIRSLYNHNCKNEGFRISKFKKIENPLYKPKTLNEDKILSDHIEPKYTILKSVLGAKESLVVNENNKKYVAFSDYLLVNYIHEKEDYNYSVKYGRSLNNFQNSELQLKEVKVEIFADGNYSPADKIVFFGYMAWEKMGDMLPYDYQP